MTIERFFTVEFIAALAVVRPSGRRKLVEDVTDALGSFTSTLVDIGILSGL